MVGKRNAQNTYAKVPIKEGGTYQLRVFSSSVFIHFLNKSVSAKPKIPQN
jgi:hypothetical protein